MAVVKLSPDLVKKFIHLKKGEIYLNEAQFGLSHVFENLRSLPPGSRVLEVGSGPGILLAELSKLFPDLHIEGIEPNSQGFEFFSDFQSNLENQIKIHCGGYETFDSNKSWDFIFSVNVFEHLPDWKNFIGFLKQNLSSRGTAMILCPNYSFPYESHFGLPIIFTKRLTYFFFQNYIRAFEKKNECAGLWQSLNFVKYREVARCLKSNKMELISHLRIVEEMVQRLSYDKQFAQRQMFLSLPARFLMRTNLLTKILKFPGIRYYVPYMHLEIKPG